MSNLPPYAPPSIAYNLKHALSARGTRSIQPSVAPWNPAPNWAATTVYFNGQRVISNGNLYTCVNPSLNVAGTSGTTAPSTTSAAQFTDGTVTWEYLGPALFTTALPNAPSYSISGTASTLPHFYRNAASTFASGATTVVSNDNWFTPLGGFDKQGGINASGIGYYGGALNGGTAFWTDSLSICIASVGYTANGMMIDVDGQCLVAGLTPDTVLSFGTNYRTITFADRRPRRIVLRYLTSTGVPLKGIYCESTASIWADATTPALIRMSYVCDSFGQTQGYQGDFFDRSYCLVAARTLGIDNLLLDSIGGSGFVGGGTSLYSNAQRIGYHTAWNPHVIVVAATLNDEGNTQAAITAGVQAWYNPIRAALPNTLIVFHGSLSHYGAGAVIATETQTKTAVQAIQASDPRVFWFDVMGDVQGPWMYGTGSATNPKGDGNGDLYTGADGNHPNVKGRNYMGCRIAEKLEQVFNLAA